MRASRLENTGTWLLEDERYCHWQGNDSIVQDNDRVLCCYGIPGAGKTVIRLVANLLYILVGYTELSTNYSEIGLFNLVLL